MKKLFVLAFVSVAALGACSKKNGNTTPQPAAEPAPADPAAAPADPAAAPADPAAAPADPAAPAAGADPCAAPKK